MCLQCILDSVSCGHDDGSIEELKSSGVEITESELMTHGKKAISELHANGNAEGNELLCLALDICCFEVGWQGDGACLEKHPKK